VRNSRTRRLLQAGITLLLLAGLYYLRARSGEEPPTAARLPASPVLDAYQRHRSNIEVVTGGRVTRVLADDREGARHQRFLVRVTGPVTVLVAHNLDLAPRVPLAVGDSVELRGEYEWNDRGGVLHWTHRDPDGRHDAGWIRHDGRLYQ
jgi:hypothetical protein